MIDILEQGHYIATPYSHLPIDLLDHLRVTRPGQDAPIFEAGEEWPFLISGWIGRGDLQSLLLSRSYSHLNGGDG